MRASTDQVRHATADAVDAARHHASDLVTTGAGLVTSTLDRGAHTIEAGIERVADKAPMVAVAVKQQPRRHRVRTTLVAIGVIAVILIVARKVLGGTAVPETVQNTSEDAVKTGQDKVPDDVKDAAKDAARDVKDVVKDVKERVTAVADEISSNGDGEADAEHSPSGAG